MSDPSPEMVKRVAKAYAEAYFIGCEWDREGPTFHKNHLRATLAAIAVMREPTEAMCAAGSRATGGDIPADWLPEPWRAMIDAALHHGPV